MANIDPVTNHLGENELAAVSGGMDMVDPIDAGGSGSSSGSGGLVDAGGVGAWAAGGPVGYLIYQGGVGIGLGIKDWLHGRK
jgi:hypothetical protein